MGQIYDEFSNEPFDPFAFQSSNQEVFAKYEALVRSNTNYYNRIKNDQTQSKAAKRKWEELDTMILFGKVVEYMTSQFVSTPTTIGLKLERQYRSKITSLEERVSQLENTITVLNDVISNTSKGESMMLEMVMNGSFNPSKRPAQ